MAAVDCDGGIAHPVTVISLSSPRMPLYLDVAGASLEPRPSLVSTLFDITDETTLAERVATLSLPGERAELVGGDSGGSGGSSRYNTPQTFATPESGNTPPLTRALLLGARVADANSDPGGGGVVGGALPTGRRPAGFPATEALPISAASSSGEEGRARWATDSSYLVHVGSSDSQEGWTVIGEEFFSDASLSVGGGGGDNGPIGGSRMNGHPGGFQAAGYTVEQLEESLTRGAGSGPPGLAGLAGGGASLAARNGRSLGGPDSGSLPNGVRGDAAPLVGGSQPSAAAAEESGGRPTNFEDPRLPSRERQDARRGVKHVSPSKLGIVGNGDITRTVAEERRAVGALHLPSLARQDTDSPVYYTPTQTEPGALWD